MNALAKQLKMERTRFVNPHGIDYKVKPVPYSTAEDMARLTHTQWIRQVSASMCRKRSARLRSIERAATQLHASQHEELLGKMGIDGVKTGTSARSGSV